MKGKIRVLIVCGSGIATSTVVACAVKGLFKQEGIEASFKQTMTSAARMEAKNADLIISTTSVPDVEIPVISGIGYITGRNVDEINNEILKVVRNIN